MDFDACLLLFTNGQIFIDANPNTHQLGKKGDREWLELTDPSETYSYSYIKFFHTI